MLGLQKAPQINQVQQQQQNDIQKQLSQQLEQIDQQNTQIVEVIKKEDDNNQGQESISIKNDNENNQQINIPLFFYRPSFQSEEQQSQLSQNAIVRNTLLKKQNSFNLVSKKMNLIFQLNQKQKLSFEEDEFKNIKDSFTCKYISDDKQNLSQFSDSIYSLRNLNSKQKHLSKEISFNDSATYNNRDANVFKKKNETSYKQSLISQDKKPPDENINECLKKLKDIQNNDTSNKIKKLLFKFRLCKRRQKLQDSEMLSQIQQKKIENHISQELDILHFFNDMIFLKKAVMLLLRKDQLAALKLVGFSQNILDLDLNEYSANTQNKKKELSYYEMQYAILQSEKLQQQDEGKTQISRIKQFGRKREYELQNLARVRDLIEADPQLPIKDAIDLNAGIQKCTNLQSLQLEMMVNNLDNMGASVLYSRIEKCSNLQLLSIKLGHNRQYVIKSDE
ncbi:hypothetical protein ABPG73_008955 [Tetrahymena malaccensis]